MNGLLKRGLALLFLTLVTLPCAMAQPPGAPVRLATAETQSIAPGSRVSGTVVSREDVTLSTEVEGRLIRVAEPGTRFARDDIVAQIEDVALRLREEELVSEVRRAEARRIYLDAELLRRERIGERGHVSLADVEQIRSERDVALGDKAVAESRLAQVRHQIERAQVRAPFDGIVAERLARSGERVAVGTPVVRMLDPDDVEIVARAPLGYYRYQSPGDRLYFTADGRELGAQLRTVVVVGSEFSHVFELRLDPEDALPVGQTVRLRIPTANAQPVLTVPRDALVLRSDGISVFVVDQDNVAHQRRVTTGTGSGELIEIRGPVEAGDRVVIRGAERLREGQPVRVLDNGEAGPGSP